MPTPHRMTREEFQTFVTSRPNALYVAAPFDVVPCECGDLNCHGWRFVERRRERRVTDIDLREAAFA